MCSSRWSTLAALLLPAACFPVEQVDLPQSVKIDDFEDGDNLAPFESGFAWWWGSTWATGPMKQPIPTYGTSSPGYESDAAFFVIFRLERFPAADYTEAVLGVDADGTRDVRSFRSLSFVAKFEPGDPPPPKGTRLECEFSCEAAFAEFPDATPVVMYYNRGNSKYGFELTGDWSSYTLQLADFEEPWWQGSAVQVETCLGLVHTLRFVIRPDLRAGEAAEGTLLIDDIYLE